jgi:hypothetical protein
MRQAYLARGTEMIDYLDAVGVRFWPSKKVVNYHPETAAPSATPTSAGSAARFRSLPSSAAPSWPAGRR